MDKSFKVANKNTKFTNRYVAKPKHSFHRHHGYHHYHRYNRYHRHFNNKWANQKLFKSLNYVMVVSGYHYGWRKDKKNPNNKKAFYPYVSFKPYNFKVDIRTRGLKLACENRAKTATVKTVNGAQKLYITKIAQITNKFGSAVINEAKQLKPVISFSGNTPKKSWFAHAIKRQMKKNK